MILKCLFFSPTPKDSDSKLGLERKYLISNKELMNPSLETERKVFICSIIDIIIYKCLLRIHAYDSV